MPFHVYLFEYRDEARSRGRGRGRLFANLDEGHLRERIVEPWELGAPITYNGETVDSARSRIEVFETAAVINGPPDSLYAAASAEKDVTNEWVTGPAGARASGTSVNPANASNARLKDPRRVMVVHGRNLAARTAMFTFLRALGLAPIEWDDAIAATGMASPHNLTAVRAAMDIAQAVVVVLTGEDRAGLLPELADSDSPEVLLEAQPRQNVTLEAGMAMGIDPVHTILVQMGHIRGASDFDGLNAVRLTNEPAPRAALRRRLEDAGCAVDDSGADWLSSGPGGDFDAAVIASQPGSDTHLANVMALPTTDLRNGGAELNVRCFRLPEGARVICSVTPPGYDPLEIDAPGYEVGPDQTLHSVVYPASFEGAPGVAGTHAVNWIAVAGDSAERRELVSTDFRVP